MNGGLGCEPFHRSTLMRNSRRVFDGRVVPWHQQDRRAAVVLLRALDRLHR